MRHAIALVIVATLAWSSLQAHADPAEAPACRIPTGNVVYLNQSLLPDVPAQFQAHPRIEPSDHCRKVRIWSYVGAGDPPRSPSAEACTAMAQTDYVTGSRYTSCLEFRIYATEADAVAAPMPLAYWRGDTLVVRGLSRQTGTMISGVYLPSPGGSDTVIGTLDFFQPNGPGPSFRWNGYPVGMSAAYQAASESDSNPSPTPTAQPVAPAHATASTNTTPPATPAPASVGQ